MQDEHRACVEFVRKFGKSDRTRAAVVQRGSVRDKHCISRPRVKRHGNIRCGAVNCGDDRFELWGLLVEPLAGYAKALGVITDRAVVNEACLLYTSRCV